MSDQLFVLFRSDFDRLDIGIQRKLFLSFRELVYRELLFITNDPYLVDDIIQTSFHKVITGGPRIKNDSNIKAWLKQIARNTTYDFLRKNKKYRHDFALDYVNTYEDVSFELSASEVQIDVFVEKSVRDELLHKSINELKFENRVVILLFYFLGLSYREIQQELGISEDVLAKRLERARKKLAQIFSKRWSEEHE
ncbi:RNA polymerase sigma factor [Paenibacillus sp. N3.4]|uniref:RNA polymerase sigma factor n=1 Tax=Paenibacillus sp. N3.4 TaxID=2603222 RepID=UPI00164F9D2E|nr:sigma-70 family RNA polymerase sigma factor [Paenibacillus sp. N3.4]